MRISSMLVASFFVTALGCLGEQNPPLEEAAEPSADSTVVGDPVPSSPPAETPALDVDPRPDRWSDPKPEPRPIGPDCGDGRLQAGEQCDDGNGSNRDACRVDCMLNVCGDGWVLDGAEECDDASDGTSGSCVDCRVAFCGDGFVEVGAEACDDGLNDGSASSCLPDCSAGPVGCRDASIEQHFGADMQGCGGHYSFEEAAAGYLCAEGWHLCSAEEWNHGHGAQPADLHYWVSDALSWMGGAPAGTAECSVKRTPEPFPAQPCPGQLATSAADSPMHVCTDAPIDGFGNECAVRRCMFEGRGADNSFGGCGERETAGALCCR